MTRPRILAIAYACMPGVGSEPGAGWAWARILAGIGETWVLTRPWPGRRAELEAAVAAAPERDALHVVYVDLPRPLGTPNWDPFQTGHQRLEYILWQIAALRTARRIARQERIDLVWHLTFANVWMGSIGALVGPRFILGPMGGGVGPAWGLLKGFGPRGMAFEAVRSLVRTASRYLNPLARVAWTRAAVVLVQNGETYRWLPESAQSRTEIFHNVALEDAAVPRIRERVDDAPPVAMFAGRLIPLKGVVLGIRAIARLPGWRFVIAGSGPDEPRLRGLATRLGVADRVEFRGWVAREAVLRAMREEADLFLFPSFHDEGGWAVGEALAAGLPVVCLDRGGPPIVGGRGVPVGDERVTVAHLVRAAAAAVADTQPLPPAPTLEERRRGVVSILRRRGILDAAPDS